MTGELVFSATGTWFWLGCLALIMLVALSAYHGIRQDWNGRTLRLELLRILAACMVVLTLAKPEWWQTLKPTTKPVVVLLTDKSGSMDTPDIPISDGSQETRRAWLERQSSLPMWENLAERYQLQWQAFESAESEQTDLHQAIADVATSSSDLAAVVLFSDGDANSGGDPTLAARMLRTRGVPLHAVAVGDTQALPDLAIELLPMPKSVAMDEPVEIPFRVTNQFAEPQEVKVNFTIGDQVVDTKTVAVAAASSRRDRIVWTPSKEGDVSWQITIPELPDEVRRDNNRIVERTAVRHDQIKVLVVESVPRWEFRYSRNALMRDPGVEVSSVLFHPEDMGFGEGPGYLSGFPATPQALTAYDVVFLGDVGVSKSQLSQEDAQHLKGLVEHQASGLVFVPGRRSNHLGLVGSALEELIPVAFDATKRHGIGASAPSELELTEAGRQNVLTLLGDSSESNASIWRSLPGFYWHAAVERSKAGAMVLAVHGSSRNEHGRLPLLVTRPFGRGKTLFLGTDGAWRWRRGVEDKYHYRFWGQVARWMAYQRNLAEGERARLIHYPEVPKSGHEMQWHATVLGADLGPIAEQNVTIEWQRDADRGQLALEEEEGAWGTYSGSFVPTDPGHYEIELRTDDGMILETSLQVVSSGIETVGDAAKPEILRELAEITGGDLVDAMSLERLADRLQTLPEVEPTIRRTALWHHALWMITIITMLGLFWINRKRAGLM